MSRPHALDGIVQPASGAITTGIETTAKKKINDFLDHGHLL